MKRMGASLLVLGLIALLAEPGVGAEAWRDKVLGFTDTLFKQDMHNRRDYLLARRLAAADHVALDDDVLFAAAYLHDVGSMPGWEEQGKEHGDVSAAKLDRMLAGTDFPAAKMEAVRGAMRTHMFYRDPVGPEARYLHDADALDNVGTIGIAGVLSLTGQKGKITNARAIGILQKAAPTIEARVVTPAGKAEMRLRIAERKAFLDSLSRETDGFKTY